MCKKHCGSHSHSHSRSHSYSHSHRHKTTSSTISQTSHTTSRFRIALTLFTTFFLLLSLFHSADAGKDYYNLLGIARDANEATIKRAFRKLSLKYHPDKNKGDEKAEKKFVEIAAAYEVLMDPQKRRIYDQAGEEGVKNMNAGGGGSGGSAGGFDPFDAFFGGHNFGFGGRRSNEPRERKGPDIFVPLFVTLEQIYSGDVLEAAFRKQTICSGWSACEKKCSKCGGSGVILETRQIGIGFVQQIRTTCPKCNGSGKIAAKKQCTGCPNGQFEFAENVLLIDLEKGVPEGHRIEFQGEADEIPDASNGDLIFLVREEPHPYFQRIGADLHMQMNISLSEALVGIEREIIQLDGRKVILKKDSVTIPNQVFKIEREGMPIYGSHDEKFGDLFIKFWVNFPEKLSAKMKTVVEDTFGKAPRLDAAASTEPKSETTRPPEDEKEL